MISIQRVVYRKFKIDIEVACWMMASDDVVKRIIDNINNAIVDKIWTHSGTRVFGKRMKR